MPQLPDHDTMMKQLAKQNEEFDAVVALAKTYNNLPAVVDDDYPEMRHYYERSMQRLIRAIRDNGRIS